MLERPGGRRGGAPTSPLLALLHLPAQGLRSPCSRCRHLRRKQRLVAAVSASTGLSLVLLVVLHTYSAPGPYHLTRKSSRQDLARELPEKSHYVRDVIVARDGAQHMVRMAVLKAATYSSDRRPRTLSDGRPKTLSDGRPRTLSDGRPKTLSDGRPRTLSDGRPKTLSDRRPGTLSDGRPGTLSDNVRDNYEKLSPVYQNIYDRTYSVKHKPKSFPLKQTVSGKHPRAEHRAPRRRSRGHNAVQVYQRRGIDSPTGVNAVKTSKNTTRGATLPPAGFRGLVTAPEGGGEGQPLGPGPHPPLLLLYDYSRPSHFPWRTTKDECANYATRFLVGGRTPLIPLASFPGAGNTWLRYLAETLTGVFTGSVYHDEILALRGFLGERDGYRQGTTLLQKTHSFPMLPEEVQGGVYSGTEFRFLVGRAPRKVVVLLRSPWESLLALRHYHAAGHTGFGSAAFFRGPTWANFTVERGQLWADLNAAWLSLPHTSVHVVHYEHLQHRLEYEAERLMRFLGLPVDYGRIDCLVRYPEGRFRRPKYPKHLQGYRFPAGAIRIVNAGMATLNKLLVRGGHPQLPSHLYSFRPLTDPAGDTPVPLVVVPAGG
ncbi:uncharacterized protein [Procambarus clarkii]|uniref:uncharacterized protein n=1 Tax=Procambarus clarkii TaxID=6728 RepID=UPI00374450E5